MTATYDPALCERLIAEARRDDERMTPAPWKPDSMSTSRDYGRIDGPRWPVAQICYDDDRRTVTSEFDPGECVIGDINGIARTRNNLRAIADQLEAAGRDLQHAISENFAFNVKVSSEISGLRRELHAVTAERAALRAEVERLRAVVDAAGRWRGDPPDELPLDATHLDVALADAVDACRAASKE